MRRFAIASALAVPALVLGPQVFGQGRGGAPQSAQAGAPVDLTGYWVSLVTEDWRFRMVTPPKGDFASIPVNAEGRKIGEAWDPDKDTAAGEQCKSYGAAALMRVPGRVHITWNDENTLKIETDAGTQTRLLHFGNAQPPGGAPDWQGLSMASWEIAGARGGRGGGGGGGGGGRGGGGGPPGAAAAAPRGGALKVVTTRMRPGYLRKNGYPYSANAVLTEYMDRTVETNGDSYLIVTSIVDDPQYLAQQFVTSTHFRKLPDASGWNPTPCEAK